MAEKTKWIQPGISIGNLIVLVTMLVSIVFGWARLEFGLAQHEKRIADLEAAEKLLADQRMREARDFATIKADMQWIRQALKRLEEDLNRDN